MNSRIYMVLALGALISPAAVQAEEDVQDKAIATMEEVVVTATKTEEKRKDVANSVILLDENNIMESPAKSVGELLANQPGIDLRTRGNYGGASEEIHIRGMGADATQVMVNGVVVNSPSFGSADVSQIPLNSIERIEVVKGPGSLLHGSGAMGGTVSIITKQPEHDTTDLAVHAGYGTEDTYQLSAEHGMFLTGDFGYYLTANRYETEGFRDNSDLEHTDGSLKLLLDKGDTLNVNLYSDFVDRRYGLPGPKPPEGTEDYYINGVLFYNSESASLVSHGEDENFRTALEVKSQVAEWLNLRLKTDYTVQESYNYNRYSWDGTGDESVVTNTIKGIEGNAALSPLSWAAMLTGIEYRDYGYEIEQQSLDNTGAPVIGGVSDSEHDVFTEGAFLEVNVRPVEPVKLIAGYRHEKHSTFGHEDVARYGMVVNPLENTVIKVNHGKHFKAPTMNDLFWPDDGFAKGNPDLKPETGWHTDFTVEQSLLEDYIFTTVSYFKWDIDDKIDWAEDPTQPTVIPGWNYWTPSNVNSYRATGWEFNAKVGPYYSLVADLSLTLLDAEEEKAADAARQARYTPKRQFKGDITHLSDFGLTTTITARYVGKRAGYYQTDTDLEPQIELDSYWTMDMKFDQVVGEHWRITVVGSNLFDTGYDTFLASFTDQTTFTTTQQPYPGAGRSVFLAAGYEF